MSNTLINIVVLALVVGTVVLALFTIVTSKKRKSVASSSQKLFDDWLTRQHFSPEHRHHFAGTGIAFKEGESRIALQNRGNIMFYPLSDLIETRSFHTTTTARPLGAAPGVVEVREVKLFNLELLFRHVADPLIIRFQQESDMLQWEQRLKAFARP